MDENEKIIGLNRHTKKENPTEQQEVDLFALAAQQPPTAEPPQENTQVDLLAYANCLESQNLPVPPQDKTNYIIDDAAIPDIELPQTAPENDNNGSTGKKFRLGKWGMAAVAVVTAFAVLFVSVMSVFLSYYSKMDYVADDKSAYYYNVKADGIKRSPFVKNILLLGTDERTAEFSDNARSDCMMLLSINSLTGTISLVSLERGMTVPYLKSESSTSSDLLTHVFKHGGAGLLMNTVENTFKVEVNDYVRVNFNTFAQVIDTLGGIDIELTAAEVRGLNQAKKKDQRVSRKLSAGVNHLSGEEALCYARLRWIDSDFRRVERQRKVILAVKEQLKGASYLKLMSVANNVLPLVQTNISAGDMASLIFEASLAMGNDTEQMTVPFNGTYSGLANVDFDQNAALLQEALY